jgi:hypothetical protein
VQQVKTANTETFAIKSTEALRFSKCIRPCDGGVRKNILFDIRIDFAKGLAALCGCNFASEDSEPNAVAKLVAMKWGDGKGS